MKLPRGKPMDLGAIKEASKKIAKLISDEERREKMDVTRGEYEDLLKLTKHERKTNSHR